MSKMALLGYDGLETPDQASAIANSYRAAGITDGDDLDIAFDRCQSSWKKNKCPRADEFKRFMPEPVLITERHFRMDFGKYQEAVRDVHAWAWGRIIAEHGNPDAVGLVIHGMQMPAAFAPENEWLRRFYPLDKCAKYVRLKLRHEGGFGGVGAVDAAKADIFPTLAEVQKAREIRHE